MKTNVKMYDIAVIKNTFIHNYNVLIIFSPSVYCTIIEILSNLHHLNNSNFFTKLVKNFQHFLYKNFTNKRFRVFVHSVSTKIGHKRRSMNMHIITPY